MMTAWADSPGLILRNKAGKTSTRRGTPQEGHGIKSGRLKTSFKSTARQPGHETSGFMDYFLMTRVLQMWSCNARFWLSKITMK